jgi:hypothetical protein
MPDTSYAFRKADPDRVARQLVADLKWGKITRVDHRTVEATCDAELRAHGTTSAERRQRFIADTTRQVFWLQAQRHLARTGCA